MIKLSWHTEQRKVKDLHAWDRNPRRISDKDKDDLARSLEKFDYVEVVIINTDNRIIGGHQRVSQLLDAGKGEEKIEVRVPNRKLSNKEFEELAIRLNKNRGEWDEEKLQDFFTGDDLKAWGFNQQELNNIFDDAAEITEDEFDAEKEARKIKRPQTNPGDLYILGNHKLLCADSKDPANVSILMAADQASMVYCDPPYNINYNYESGLNKGKKVYTEQKFSDSKSIDQYRELISSTLSNAIANAGKHIHVFYWCDQNYIGMVQDVFRQHGITPKRVCFWIKNTFNPVPQSAFNKLIEPCVYGTIGSPHLNGNIKNITELLNSTNAEESFHEAMVFLDAWLIHRTHTNDYEHPTQKPLSLHEKPLKRCSSPGNIVIDLFGGGGSTLISCEQLGRKARLIEQDPIFCDVIVRRWERLTGKKAKLIRSKNSIPDGQPGKKKNHIQKAAA